MENYKTYIDESGNTGDNLTDKNQKFFVLAAISIPSLVANSLQTSIDTLFKSVKEKEETEIKATKWLRSPKKNAVLKSILEKLIDSGCNFSVVLVEKRYMVTSLIVDDFLDGAYNDIEDYTWCNDHDEKVKASQYFYKILNDSDIDIIANAFTHPTLEAMRNSLDIVLDKTQEPRYRMMLQGCHIDELFQDDLNLVEDTTEMSHGAVRSPNYTAFSALGTIIANQCKRNKSNTDVVFDSCLLCNDAYKHLVGLFQRMKSNEIIESMLGIFPWTNIINNFEVSNSKNNPLLQTADIVATSVLKTTERIFNDEPLQDYDNYMIKFIKVIFDNAGFLYVLGEENMVKLLSNIELGLI